MLKFKNLLFPNCRSFAIVLLLFTKLAIGSEHASQIADNKRENFPSEKSYPSNPNSLIPTVQEVRDTVNMGASRIVRALGCSVVADSNILREAINTWGPEIQRLGQSPESPAKKLQYDKYVREVAFDYLNGPEVCQSDRTECNKQLNQPIARLFEIFRTTDINDNSVKREIDQIQKDINSRVAALRAKGKTPQCLIDRETASSKTVDVNHGPGPLFPLKADSPVKDDKYSKFYAALVAQGANSDGVKKALDYFFKNRGKFKNQKYISFIDYTKGAMKKRYFLLNTETLLVEKFKVAHGKKSGPYGGIPQFFSNEHGTLKSSLGAYRVAETDNNNPNRKHDIVTWLDGLESTNSHARKRKVYMHGAWYVPIGGRSWGCPALSMNDMRNVQSKTAGGSFLYIYSNVL